VFASVVEQEKLFEIVLRFFMRAMASAAQTGPVYRFGVFEVFVESRELYRRGKRVKLQDQPFQLLLHLLEHSGEVVSREFLQERLWAENTFVEFGQSLATAVTKLRQALGDDAETPSYIETVPRRGYRFIASVSLATDQPVDSTNSAIPDSPRPAESRPFLASKIEVLESPAGAVWRKSRKLAWFSVAAMLFAGVVAAYWYHREKAFLLVPKDLVVLADFENATGEGAFDDALRQGLIVGLEQSPVIQVLSDRKSAVILEQMMRSPDQRLVGSVAIELCRRVGGKIAVQGSISRLGTNYLVGLTALRCDSGEPIAHELAEANRKENVINALGRAAAQLRARLGESLPSIQRYNAPLELATTPSLDALNTYSRALAAQNHDGDQASIPLFEKAIELDPNFAMAYTELAAIDTNRGESGLARDNAIKAYKLRERVTGFEKASIDFWYHVCVTGDLNKAAQVYEIAVENYPAGPRFLNDLGIVYGTLGQYEKAVDVFRSTVHVYPIAAATYGNLATALMALNRGDEARAVLAEADKSNLQTEYLLQVKYWYFFLRGDNEAMQRLISQAPNIPGAQSVLLNEQANSAAYFGQFDRAGQLTSEASDLMIQEGDRESAAACWAAAAIRESEAGQIAQAHESISKALRLTHSRDIMTLAAQVMARSGDYKHALLLSEELNKKYPSDTLIQKYWLPVVRAQVALKRGKLSESIAILSGAEPLEFAISGAISTSVLYPAYLRGQAYLAGRDGERAAIEFQKVIDHRGMVLNFPLGALAYLGRARAYTLIGNFPKAKNAYLEFLSLWKGADPNILVLRQARSELAHLNPPSR
jgi:eukaryotic-like serine/threonine-protein kinase